MKNECVRITSKFIISIAITIFANSAQAQSMTIQFLNGKSGRPISKGTRVWVHVDDGTGQHILDLHTDPQGEVRFDTDAKTFQVSPVGYVPCGEQPIGSPQKDFSVEETREKGIITKNDCSSFNSEPIRGKLSYFVRSASWWELFKN